MLEQCSRFLLPAPKGEKTKAADPAISIVQIVTIYINNIITCYLQSSKVQDIRQKWRYSFLDHHSHHHPQNHHHYHHFHPPIMNSILLAAPNEAKAKTSDKSGDIVAQLPLGRHEEGVEEGPRPIPALVMMIYLL